ncbi:sterol desaturase family protein [Blastopirellula sp. JC732]|uniref:Sterol desaturase family protein n=1 Tax=Blastopirellula sediminis TaxID=2894196 RepID=A0A9X1SDP6_9BACT|nr:sterol desaturase family protein [Blastopirellula sediminis]MCC9604370.1 sterol desaturase family protein [Blastopirellula sediminis]MCC9626890.1 sterol desaturase family protein [Blastopirellula sediminis]
MSVASEQSASTADRWESPQADRAVRAKPIFLPFLKTVAPWLGGLFLLAATITTLDWALGWDMQVVSRARTVFALVYMTNLIRYVVAAGGAFLLFYVILWRTGWITPIQKKLAAAPEMRREIFYSISSLTIFAGVGVIVYLGKASGVLQFYYGGNPLVDYYFWFSVVAMIVIHDAWFYWTHRLLHTKLLYAKVHRIHHQSHNPTPWAAFAFHPVEAFVQAIILPLAAILLPMHPLTVIFWMLYMTGMNVFGHLGFELFPHWFLRSPWRRWHNTGVHHNMHHRCVSSNYGLYFNFWDQWFGTNHPDYYAEFERVTAPRSKGGDAESA